MNQPIIKKLVFTYQPSIYHINYASVSMNQFDTHSTVPKLNQYFIIFYGKFFNSEIEPIIKSKHQFDTPLPSNSSPVLCEGQISASISGFFSVFNYNYFTTQFIREHNYSLICIIKEIFMKNKNNCNIILFCNPDNLNELEMQIKDILSKIPCHWLFHTEDQLSYVLSVFFICV